MKLLPMTRSTTILATGLAVCGGVLALAAMSVAPLDAQSQPVPLAVAIPDDAAAGAALFTEKSCARCHSVGRGGAGIGPNLGDLRLEGSVLDLAGALWNHAPGMGDRMRDLGIERPTIARDEMGNLVAWLSAYQHYSRQLSEPSNPALGRNVFVSKGCASCHEGPEASTTPGPELDSFRGRSPVAFAQAMWNHADAMADAMADRDMAWPTFGGRDMIDLTAYLQVGLSLAGPEPLPFEPGSPKRGEALFTSKGCDVCHAVACVGGDGGPNLSTTRALRRSVPAIAGLMWNHSQGMRAAFEERNVARATFEGEELTDILAYLYFIGYTSVEGTPARGGELFVEKCSACHALGRVEVGPDLLAVAELDDPVAIVADMWNHATTMQETARQRDVALPQFDSGEVADLVAFLIERRAAR